MSLKSEEEINNHHDVKDDLLRLSNQMNEIKMLKSSIDQPDLSTVLEEKTKEVSGTLEEAVAEEWTLGSNQFASGNYGKCFKHHTVAVQLLLDAYEDRKLLVDKLKTELFKIQEERNFLKTKCSAVSDALSAFENTVPRGKTDIFNESVVYTEKELKELLSVTDTVINDFDSLHLAKKSFQEIIQLKNEEFNNIIAEKTLIGEELDQLKEVLQQFKTESDDRANILADQIINYEKQLEQTRAEADYLKSKFNSNYIKNKDELSATLLKIEQENRTLLDENSKLQSRNGDLQHFSAQSDVFKNENVKLIDRIESLENALKSEVEQKNNIEQNANELQEQNAALRIQLMDIKGSAEMHQNNEIIDLRQEILFLKEDLQQSHVKVDEFQSLFFNKDREIESLKNYGDTIKVYEQEIAFLKEALEASERQRTEIAQELKSMTKIVDFIQADENLISKRRAEALEKEHLKCADLEHSLNRLKMHNDKTKDENRLIQEQLDHVTREIERLNKTYTSLLDKLNYKELELTGKSREQKSLSTRNEQLLQENKELIEQQSDPALLDEFRVELSEKNLELSEYRNELKRKAQENREVRYQLEKLMKVPKILPLLEALETSFFDCLASVNNIESKVEDIRKVKDTDDVELMRSESSLLQAKTDLNYALESLKSLKTQASEEKALLEEELLENKRVGNELRAQLYLEKGNNQSLQEKLESEELNKIELLKDFSTIKFDISTLEVEVKTYEDLRNSKDDVATESEKKKKEMIKVVEDMVAEAQTVLDSTEKGLSEYMAKESTTQERVYIKMYKEANQMKVEIEAKCNTVQQKYSELQGKHQESAKKCTDLDEMITQLKLENKQILRDASEFYNIDIRDKDSSLLDKDILKKLRASMEILDETILETSDLGKENLKLKQEVTGLRHCYLLEKAMQDASNSDLSSTDYLDESSYLDEEEFSDDISLSNINDVDSLKQQMELERAESKKTVSEHRSLKQKYETLFQKFEDVAKGTLINDSVSLPQSSFPASHSLAVETTIDDLMKNKEKQVGELVQLLEQNNVDINLLTQELSKLYYKYQKSGAKGSPTSNFISILRTKVAPNILVILIAFFTALKQKSLEASIG